MHLYVGYWAAWIFLNGSAAVSLALATLATGAYIWFKPGDRLRKALIVLAVVGLLAKVGVATYLSIAQYQAWMATPFGQLFLPPHQDWSYFIRYVLQRYWMGTVLALILAALWYGFVRLIRQKSERYLDVGEPELTTILVFAIGWPDALVMAPLIAIALVLLSLFRMLVLKRELTTLGLPFIVAAFCTLAYAPAIRSLLGY